MSGAITLMLLTSAPLTPGVMHSSVKFADLGEPIIEEKMALVGWKVPTPKVQAEQESFCVLLPTNFDPEQTYGLLLYLSPSPSGSMISGKLKLEALDEVLRTHQLLYVGPNQIENKRPGWERLQVGLMAVHNMKTQYKIDAKRVVVTGLSGGGGMALMAGRYAPETFVGVIASAKAVFHRPVKADAKTAYQPDLKLAPVRERFIAQRVSFVFVTGPKDFNYPHIKKIVPAWENAKFRTLLIDDPNMGHENPAPDKLDDALKFIWLR